MFTVFSIDIINWNKWVLKFTVEFNKKTIQVISEKIGVKPKDFEYWIGKLIDIKNTRVNPKDIEIGSGI